MPKFAPCHHVAFGCAVVSPCAQNVSHLLRSWSQGMIVLAEASGWIQVGICESWVSLSDPQPYFSHVLPVLPKMLFTFSPEVQSLPPFKIKFVWPWLLVPQGIHSTPKITHLIIQLNVFFLPNTTPSVFILDVPRRYGSDVHWQLELLQSHGCGCWPAEATDQLEIATWDNWSTRGRSNGRNGSTKPTVGSPTSLISW